MSEDNSNNPELLKALQFDIDTMNSMIDTSARVVDGTSLRFEDLDLPLMEMFQGSFPDGQIIDVNLRSPTTVFAPNDQTNERGYVIEVLEGGRLQCEIIGYSIFIDPDTIALDSLGFSSKLSPFIVVKPLFNERFPLLHLPVKNITKIDDYKDYVRNEILSANAAIFDYMQYLIGIGKAETDAGFSDALSRWWEHDGYFNQEAQIRLYDGTLELFEKVYNGVEPKKLYDSYMPRVLKAKLGHMFADQDNRPYIELTIDCPEDGSQKIITHFGDINFIEILETQTEISMQTIPQLLRESNEQMEIISKMPPSIAHEDIALHCGVEFSNEYGMNPTVVYKVVEDAHLLYAKTKLEHTNAYEMEIQKNPNKRYKGILDSFHVEYKNGTSLLCAVIRTNDVGLGVPAGSSVYIPLNELKYFEVVET